MAAEPAAARRAASPAALATASDPVALFVDGGLGDNLLALPALRALARLFGGRLTLICSDEERALFYAGLPLRALHRLPMAAIRAGDLGSVDALAGALRCDLLLSPEPWDPPAIDRLLAGLAPARSVGFFPSFATALPLDLTRHAMDLAFDLPRLLDPALALEQFAGRPALPPDAGAWARHLRRRLPPGRRLLAVHAETMPLKSWPAERFAAVLDAFLGRHPEFVAVVVGQRDLDLGRGRQGRRVVPLLGLPLGHALAAVSAADLFLGVDSVMLHAADLAGVPGVGLFGPTDCAHYGFRLAPHRHACPPAPAGPHRHLFAEGQMAPIAVEAVLAALDDLLGEADG